ncbi:MAG: NAD-dependent epimerase/dehydratase family protein, partial [Candidatus Dadabacteria bacterium]|nr:NAD-dependent epimerase/dehydratase family protein [Candidatus Dadabacteria bacterium]
MKAFVTGGTGFIGPAVVRHAMQRGHTVTLFNRGRTNTHLFPEVQKLIGDRDGQIGALKNRTWDVVLDNTGYDPRHVRDSA